MSMRQWKLLGVWDGGYGYVTYNLCRHALHDVSLTLNIETGEWYSVTSISPLCQWADAPFGDPRELPDAITNKLRKIMETLQRT
mgnify:CR=1 FL=1|jgi:hypothetical protein